MAQDSRPCKGCGKTIPRTHPTGAIHPYCSLGCRPRCSVEWCEKPRRSVLYCGSHYNLWKKDGDPFAPVKRGTNVGACSLDGCDQPMRKAGWCASHYSQQQKSGKPPTPFKFKWGDGLSPCPNCGSTEHEWGQRIYCSLNCRAAFKLHRGPRPTETTCAACGVVIDLSVRGKRGQLRKTQTKLCRPCKTDYNKYKMSARELAKRDGTDCGICGLPVDMDLARGPGVMCPSVDHIVPRAKGGTHEPENLQLAHLHCNMLKSDHT